MRGVPVAEDTDHLLTAEAEHEVVSADVAMQEVRHFRYPSVGCMYVSATTVTDYDTGVFTKNCVDEHLLELFCTS